MQKNEKGVLLTLLNIYWPGLLFGGIQLGFVLTRRGTGTVMRRLNDILTSPADHLIIWIMGGAMLALTVLLVVLMLCGRTATPSDREEQIVDVTEAYADEDERFPGLNYRLRPEKRSGEPTLVERVFIPRTVPASTAKKSADTLRLMVGDREKLSVPLRSGVHTVELDGCTVTVTIEKDKLEDITRELPQL